MTMFRLRQLFACDVVMVPYAISSVNENADFVCEALVARRLHLRLVTYFLESKRGLLRVAGSVVGL